MKYMVARRSATHQPKNALVANPSFTNRGFSPDGTGNHHQKPLGITIGVGSLSFSGQHPPPSTQSPTPEPCSKSGTNAPIEKKPALAAGPCCASDCNWAIRLGLEFLTEFQGHTTTPQGWPKLEAHSHVLKTMDSCAIGAQRRCPLSFIAGCVFVLRAWPDWGTARRSFSAKDPANHCTSASNTPVSTFPARFTCTKIR